jgi:hypothetical protein
LRTTFHPSRVLVVVVVPSVQRGSFASLVAEMESEVAVNGSTEEETTDVDLLWLERATAEDIGEHLQRVKEIFEAYDVSPASTPSSSGRSSPSSSSPTHDDGAHSLTSSPSALEQQQQREHGQAGTTSSDVSDRKLPPERSKREDSGADGNLVAAGAVREQQQQKGAVRHRRHSSLIDTIVLGEYVQETNNENERQKKTAVQMKSTIFSKLLRKHSERSKGLEGQTTTARDPTEEGGNLEEFTQRHNNNNDAQQTDVGGANDVNDELVAPFLESLHEAEHAELAWMKPQKETTNGLLQSQQSTLSELGLEEQEDQVLSLGNLTMSKNSWMGSMHFDLSGEEGTPCLLSSRGDSSVLCIGTTTGLVLAKFIEDISAPGARTRTARCLPPPLQANEKTLKVTSIGTSFGLENYVVVGYSTGSIAIYDVCNLFDAQEENLSDSQMLKVVRQPECKDVPITSLQFTYCRQNQARDQSDAVGDKSRREKMKGTAKAAIGAMGMGRACTFLSCAANGLISTHSISIVAPAVSFLRRAPVLSVTTKIRGRLGSAILDCSVNFFQSGVLGAIIMQDSITIVQLPLNENQDSAQLITLGKVSKPTNAAFGAVPCVCWREMNAAESLFELLVSWDSTAQSISVQPKDSDEVEAGQTFVNVMYEWRLEQSVANLHWLDHSNTLAVFSEHGHVVLSVCPEGSFHEGLNVVESLLLQDSPIRQVASHERSFHGSSACISSSSGCGVPPADAQEATTTMQGQTALSVVCNNGKIIYMLLLSPLSRAIALFSKNATTPEIALRTSLDMLSSIRNEDTSNALYKQILVILDASMRKELFQKDYDRAARRTFSTCRAIAERQIKSQEISMLDESMAIREFLWQDAFEAFSENESSISAFTRALEGAIMKGNSNSSETQFPGSETLRVPPEVMQKLVESLASHPERIERCVIRMPIFCLDFNQVAKLCILHNLHTTFAYLYNEGLHDPLTPAIEMIRGMLKCSTPESQQNLMRKLCVYVAYCFGGKRYPPVDQYDTLEVGKLPSPPKNEERKENEPLPDLVQREEHLHLVRSQLLKLLLLCPINQLLETGTETPLLPQGALQSGPVIRAMLSIDSCLSLSTLLCAFETWDAISTDIAEASLQLNASEEVPVAENSSSDKSSTALQLAVDILSREAEECEQHHGSAGMADAGCIWMFIAHQVATGRARFGSGSGTGSELLSRVLEHLCLAASTLTELRRRESFERAALRLVDEWWGMVPNNGGSKDHTERISKLALNTKLYLLSAKIHIYCEEYEEAVKFLLMYIGDLDKSSQEDKVDLRRIRNNRCDAIFKFLTQLLNIEGRNRDAARDAVTARLKEFTMIDGNRTAELIGTIQNHSADKEHKEGQMPVQRRKTDEDKLLVEHYIKAMCQVEPDLLLSYLQKNEGNYKLDSVLTIVMQSAGKGVTFRCDDAAVHLLERLGDIAGGQKIILGVIREGLAVLSVKILELMALRRAEERGEEEAASLEERSSGSKKRERVGVHQIPEALALRECLRAAFELNFRNAQLLDAYEREELWFKILAMFVNPAHDAMIASQDARRESETSFVLLSMQSFLSTLTGDTIMAMSDAMPLTKVAARLVQEHSGSTLASFREILSDLLESCGHEVDVLATAKRVIDTDLVTTRRNVIAHRRQRVSPSALKIEHVKDQARGKGGSGLGGLGLGGSTSWLNTNASNSQLAFSSSSSSDGTIKLHLAPPPGAEFIAHGSTMNICAPTRTIGVFPQKATFYGEVVEP